MTDLTGKVALVTGGARGVGLAIARGLVRHGATVVLNYFHSRDAARAAEAELTALGGTVHLVRASVAKQDQVERMFTELRERVGGLDILVNNAAAGALLPDGELAEQHWTRAWETNLRGSQRCAELAVPLMAARGGGAIVNLSSIGGPMVIGNYATVGTSKAAVEALTRYQAVAYARHNVRVNTAAGGLIDGEVATLFPDPGAMRDVVVRATPMGRLGTEDELAAVVLFLAGDAASWVTGQTLLADGGLSLGAAMLSPEGGFPPRPAESEPVDDDALAVVGMGLICPGANGPEEFWRLRHEGGAMFREPGSRWDLPVFHDPDPAAPDRTYSRKAGYIEPVAPAQHDDYTTTWLRHAIRQAIAGVALDRSERVECFLGYTADGSQHLEEAMVAAGVRQRAGEGPLADAVAAALPRVGPRPAHYLPHAVGRDAVAGLLPEGTGVVMVDTACSSSLYAIDLGGKALREGRADVVVCGGAYALGPRNPVLFAKLQGLSKTDQVRAFDQDADGVLFADGAGVVVLKKLARARADGDRVLGIVAGVGTSSDGRGKAIYAPNADGQVLAIGRAHADAGITGADVDWVLAHATGTPAGDLTELEALGRQVGEGPLPCAVTSNKSQIGHTGWAAGVVSVIEALLGFANGHIPPQHELRTVRPEVGGTGRLVAPAGARPWPRRDDRVRLAAVSGFGFGGTNAHLVLADRPTAPGRAGPADEPVVVTGWSALVPGAPPDDEVAAWLRGDGPAPPAGFGAEYPLPPFRDIRIPPKTLRAADRCQPMILDAVLRLRESFGPLWTEYRDTTGVLVGHTGPTRAATRYTLRCYLPWLERLVAADPALREALAGLAEEVRAEVASATEDTLPGVMPNIIPARAANYFDFHGVNLAVDTGLSSSLTAIRVASAYLGTGELDLALVCGINGNATAELADLLPGEPGELAEGAFVLALTRRSFAERHDLPCLGVLREPRPGEPEPAEVVAGQYAGARSYLGAEMARAVVEGLHRPAGSTLLTCDDPVTGHQDRLVLDTPHGADRRARRHVVRLRPAPEGAARPVAEGTLAVTDDPAAADVLAARGARTVCTAEVATGEVPAVLAGIGAPVRDLLVVAGSGAAPLERRLVLHDVAFLALREWRDTLTSVRALLPGGARADYAGLFTGLVKGARWDLPGCRSSALLTGTPDVATALDLPAPDGPPVVVHDGRRLLAPVAVEVPAPAGAAPALAATSVVLATGGARGVTAELLVGLAETAAPRIWVLGRNDLDGYPDWVFATTDAEFAERKADVLRQALREPGTRPADARARAARLADARAAHRNLARMREHCGADAVHYLPCDVTDRAGVTAAVATVLAGESTVDLVLHGAGVNHSAALGGKDLADFRRIRDVKVLGHRNLRAALGDVRPPLWCNLGSVVGFAGRPGELDYGSANDFLASAASAGDGREVTIAWPLWRSVGFAADPLTRDFLERKGIGSLDTGDGVARFLAELGAPRRDPVVVHLDPVARALLEADVPGLFGAESTPLLGQCHPAEGRLCATRSLDVGTDGYVADHLVRGTPAMPGTFLVETAAQAASALLPGLVVTGFENVRLLAFLRVRAGRPTPIQVTAEVLDEHRVRVVVTSDLYSPRGVLLRSGRPHAEVTVRLGAALPEPEAPAAAPAAGVPARDPYLLPNDQLQLAGLFDTTRRGRIGPEGPVATFRLPDAAHPPGFADYRTPAVLLDGLLRVAALTTDEYPATLAAPSEIDRIELYDGRNDVELAAAYPDGVTVRYLRGEDRLLAQGPHGQPLAGLAGVRTVELGGVARAAVPTINT